MNITCFLLVLILLGFIAQSKVVVVAGFTLLLLEQLKLKPTFVFLSNKGLEIGLVFLLLSVLAPIIIKPINWDEIKQILINWKGITAIIAGILATQFNGMGLELLEEMPQLIVGVIVGSLIGIVVFKGIPVGPLMAGGIAALLVEFITLVKCLLKIN
ncbi:MAG: DUF441 domain-containing protein [Halanaerobiales bacterium]